MEIRKAIVTSAGKATRMRPISNVIPKGLLPVFKTIEGRKYPTPVIDLIIESLREAGASQLCFVVGTKGRMLTDYLFERDITFVFQKEPKGFGDAVLKAEEFANSDPFFVHADDDFMTGGYKDAASIFGDLEPDCLLFLSRVENPQGFGVVEAVHYKDMHSHKVFKVNGVQEKPENPKSDLAICGSYIFSPRIFGALRKVKSQGELQLTQGIEEIIKDGGSVYGMLLEEESWLSLGNPADYFRTLSYSYGKL
ncbi:MAG: sugar nucleotidyltransferase [Candidatus Micrarchaeota archaeon]|nr:sugar nucleotidyltransferase [Candidatus Micrarchaeota archaeon]